MKIKCPKCKQEFNLNVGKLVGKSGKGVKRKFSPEEIKLRTERLKANRFQRPKKVAEGTYIGNDKKQLPITAGLPPCTILTVKRVKEE